MNAIVDKKVGPYLAGLLAFFGIMLTREQLNEGKTIEIPYKDQIIKIGGDKFVEIVPKANSAVAVPNVNEVSSVEEAE